MKYLFWWNRIFYAKRLLEITVRLGYVKERRRSSDRYKCLCALRDSLSEELAANWHHWFYSFDVSSLKRLEGDSASFMVYG